MGRWQVGLRGKENIPVRHVTWAARERKEKQIWAVGKRGKGPVHLRGFPI